jgi:hypothetical protein
MRFASSLAILASLASTAPSMTRNHVGRGPMNRRPMNNGAAAAAPASGTGATPTTGAAPAAGAAANSGAGAAGAGAAAADERTHTQADLDRIVSREKATLARKHAEEIAALRACLPADDEAPAAGTATAADPKTKREQERLAKERDDAKAASQQHLARYHATLIDGAAARSLAGVEFVGADAQELVEARVRAMLKIEVEGTGDAAREVVYLVDGSTEIAVTDREKVAAHIRKRWPSQIKAASGSGSPHGAGKGAIAGEDLSKLTPGQKLARGMASQTS